MNTYRIYVHYEKDTLQPFYVGRAVNKYRPYAIHSRNALWHNKVNKHGLIVRVFGGNFSKDYASKLEQRLINLYSRKYRLANLTAGGDGCTGLVHSDITKQKMSNTRKGVPHSAEWSAKISATHKARFKAGALPGATFYTDESRQKLAEASRRRRNYPRKNSKPVHCMTTDELFVSCAHAANTHGVDKENLRRHLNRTKYYNTIGGRIYQWRIP